MNSWTKEDHLRLVRFLNLLEEANQNKILYIKDVVAYNRMQRKVISEVKKFFIGHNSDGEMIFEVFMPKKLKRPNLVWENILTGFSNRRFVNRSGEFEILDARAFTNFLYLCSEHVLKNRPSPLVLDYLWRVERFMSKVSRMEEGY